MKLRKILFDVAHHHLVRRTVTLQFAGVFGTLTQAIAGVLLARFLQPELYGQYALAFSIASISSVFIGGAIIDSITPVISRAWVRADKEYVRDTVGFYVRFLIVCAFLTLVLVVFLPSITARLYGNGKIGMYAGIIVIASIFSTAVFSLTQLFLQIVGKIRTLAVLTLADVLTRYSTSLLFVTTGLGIAGAVAGHFVGAVAMLFVAGFLYMRLESSHPLLPKLRHFVALAKKATWRPLLVPTLWVMTDSNVAMLFGALPVALVGLRTTGAELAYFKLAFGYIILAMSVLGPISTIMNVHFPTLQSTTPQQLRRSFIRVTLAATAFSAFVTACAIGIAPLVFRFLYGDVYLPAVQYVYGFFIFGSLFGLGVGLGPMWRSLGRVRQSVLFNLSTLAIGIPLGLWMIGRWHLWGAVAMVTIWYTVSHIISLVFLMRKLAIERSSLPV